jgi:predicted nuclease of predicted toxin-antitoxin system
MKIIADENIDYKIIQELRNEGIEVFSISESQFGIKDKEVLEVANHLEALLITEDKDFGELVFRLRLPNHGVLLIRLSDDLPRATIIGKVVETILKYNESLFHCFSVLDDYQMRTKRLPR